MLVLVGVAGAVVKPGAVGVSHQSRGFSLVNNFHPADIRLVKRKDQLASSMRSMGRFRDVGGFVHDNAGEEDRQHEPDDVEAPADWTCVHRCLHHTVMPTNASTAGIRKTESTKVPLTCRLVMLRRGRSCVRGSRPMRFSWATR